MNEEQLTARQVEAFAILEKELAAEIKYEQHNAEQLLRFFREAGGTDVSETPAANQVAESSNGPLAEAAAGAVLGPASDAADGQGYAATPVGTSSEGGAESAQSTGGTGSTIESALTTFLEGGLGLFRW